VSNVFTVPGGPIPPGNSRSFEVRSGGHFDRLALLTKLVNTNDACTRLDSTQGHDEDGALRRRQRARQRAGRFHPGPCCNNPFVRDPEGALIDHHEGINGVGDLDSAVDGWTGRPGSPSSGCPSLRLPRTGRADHSTQPRIICFRANLWLVTGIRCSVEIVGHRTVVDEWSVRG
jgi:hypothetical protein